MKARWIAVLTVVSFVAALGAEASAISTTQLWTSRYDGPADSYDRAAAVTASPDGETVFVVGQSFGPPRVSYYATIAYKASTGAQLWIRRYPAQAIGHGSATDVAVSPDGARVFVTGASTGETAGQDFMTIAYEASTGIRLWRRRYNGPANGGDGASSLAVSPDGSMLFVTGGSEGAREDDYATVAYDAFTGAKKWVSRYGGPGGDCDRDYANAIASSGDRVFVTGGSCAGPGMGYATLAYDATTGSRLWLKRYDYYEYGHAYSLAVSPNGEAVFVTGLSAGEASEWDYATIAYDAATGATSWEKRYNGRAGEQDAASALTVSPDGSMIFVTGSSEGTTGYYEYATVAYDSVTGRKQWVQRYNGDANAIAVSPDGSSVFVTGHSGDSSAQGDYATVAYDASTGAKRWVQRYNGPGDEWDYATSIAVSPDGTKVFVTGASFNSAGYDDFATIAYAA